MPQTEVLIELNTRINAALRNGMGEGRKCFANIFSEKTHEKALKHTKIY